MKTRYILSCLLLGGALSVSAQKMAVKSNLLSAANGALMPVWNMPSASNPHSICPAAYARGNARKDMSTNIGSYNLNTATGLARNSTAVFGEPISTERSST